MRRSSVLCGLALALLQPTAAWPQRVAPLRIAPQSAHTAPVARDTIGPPDWWAPVSSAVFPGTGQLALRQDRFVAYLAVEGYGWLRYFTDRGEGRRARDSYIALSARVARAPYSDSLPFGNFEYYERMEHWIESGVYNRGTSSNFQPETDTTTFNGATWLLARRTYFANPDSIPDPSSPAYARALLFYERRAIKPEYRWSWRNAQLQQDVYRRTISRSNAGYRQAADDLSLLLANHVLSMVDAYVTIRVGRRGAEDREISVTVPIPGRRW